MATQLTLAGAALRFALGGSAVVASALVARKLGGKAGGLFAAFPAVYLAAMLTSALAQPSSARAGAAALAVTQGAMIGMSANVICAACTARFVKGFGWKKGLAFGLSVWAVVATALFFVMRSTGIIS